MVGSSICMPSSAPGQADLGQAGAEHRLAHDERRPAGSAGLLAVVVGEHHAFVGDPVDVGRLVAHQAMRVGRDVRLADIVAPDDEDVRLDVLRPRRRGKRGGEKGDGGTTNVATPAVEFRLHVLDPPLVDAADNLRAHAFAQPLLAMPVPNEVNRINAGTYCQMMDSLRNDGLRPDLASAAATLGTFGWLADRDATFRNLMLSVARSRTFQPKQAIYRVGDEPDGLYGVYEGSVSVSIPSEWGLTILQSGRTRASGLEIWPSSQNRDGW